MRDAVFVLVLLALFAFGLKRPFLWVLVYAYVDIVAPQRLTYYLLNAVPVSLIAAGFAVLGWACCSTTSVRCGCRPANG